MSMERRPIDELLAEELPDGVFLNRHESACRPGVDYSGDEYPREGCIVAVDVQRDGFQMMVRDPSGRILETYRPVRTAECVARMVGEWCAGEVPGLCAPKGQSSSGSTVTE